MSVSRKLPEGIVLPAIPAPRSARPGYRERTFDIRNITPVIGGGVVAGAADPVTPVRGTSVRGQLRFWWRARARPRSGESLRDRESVVWGSASKPGLVELEVETVRASTPLDNWAYFDSMRDRLGSLSAMSTKYVLFPLQLAGRRH